MTGEINADWLEGRLRGLTGMFPTVFVEDIKEGPGMSRCARVWRGWVEAGRC